MIEVPRAALTADDVAPEADFFSFGTNDLTQMCFGYSRDDAGKFMPGYVDQKILVDDPFQVLDRRGVGQLVQMGTERGRQAKPGPEGRHLRRTRRRSRIGRLLLWPRNGLCLLLPFPRSHCATGSRTGTSGSKQLIRPGRH